MAGGAAGRGGARTRAAAGVEEAAERVVQDTLSRLEPLVRGVVDARKRGVPEARLEEVLLRGAAEVVQAICGQWVRSGGAGGATGTFPKLADLAKMDDLLQADRDLLPKGVMSFVDRALGVEEIGKPLTEAEAEDKSREGAQMVPKPAAKRLKTFSLTRRRERARLAAVLVTGAFCEAAAHAQNQHLALHTNTAMQIGMYAATGSEFACQLLSRLPCVPSHSWVRKEYVKADVVTPWNTVISLRGNVVGWYDNLQFIEGSSRSWGRTLKVPINTAVHFMEVNGADVDVQKELAFSPWVWFNRFRKSYNRVEGDTNNIANILKLTPGEAVIESQQWDNQLKLALMTADAPLSDTGPAHRYKDVSHRFFVPGPGTGDKRGRDVPQGGRVVVETEKIRDSAFTNKQNLLDMFEIQQRDRGEEAAGVLMPALPLNPGLGTDNRQILHKVCAVADVHGFSDNMANGAPANGRRQWIFLAVDHDPGDNILLSILQGGGDAGAGDLEKRLFLLPGLFHIWLAGMRAWREIYWPFRGQSFARVQNWTTPKQQETFKRCGDTHKAFDGVRLELLGQLRAWARLFMQERGVPEEDRPTGNAGQRRGQAEDLLVGFRGWLEARAEWDEDMAAALRCYRDGALSLVMMKGAAREGNMECLTAALKGLCHLWLGGPKQHRVIARAASRFLVQVDMLRARREEYGGLLKALEAATFTQGTQGFRKWIDEHGEEKIRRIKRHCNSSDPAVVSKVCAMLDDLDRLEEGLDAALDLRHNREYLDARTLVTKQQEPDVQKWSELCFDRSAAIHKPHRDVLALDPNATVPLEVGMGWKDSGGVDRPGKKLKQGVMTEVHEEGRERFLVLSLQGICNYEPNPLTLCKGIEIVAEEEE